MLSAQRHLDLVTRGTTDSMEKLEIHLDVLRAMNADACHRDK